MSEGVRGVIVDLRGSAAGSEQEVINLAEYLAGKGDVIYTLDANDNKEVICSSSSDSVDVKFVVLVDDETSGFAEVLCTGIKRFMRR